MKLTKLKNLIFLFVFVLLFVWAYSPTSHALTGGPITPEVASFTTIGGNGENVSLPSGDFQYSIPVMTVPGRNLNFPLSVRYSAGIKTDQEASWVGLGWDLNVGTIFRTTGYIPDDYRGGQAHTYTAGSGGSMNFSAFGLSYGTSWGGIDDPYTETSGGSIGITTPGYSCTRSDGNRSQTFGISLPLPALFAGLSLWKTKITRNWDVYGFLHYHLAESKGHYLDCTHDCFRREYNYANYGSFPGSSYLLDPPQDNYMVTGPGPSGKIIPWRPGYTIGERYNNNDIQGIYNETIKFYFTDHKGGAIHGSPSDSAEKIKYDLDQSTGLITSFAITDTSGQKYVYAYPAYIYESGTQGKPDDDNESRFWLTGKYAYAWHLTAILANDYIDSNQNNAPDDADSGGWLKFEYITSTNDYRYSEPYYGWRANPYIYADQQSKDSRSWGRKDLVYLTKIISPTHEAHFFLFDRLDGRESDAGYDAPGTPAGGNEHTKGLAQITLYIKAGPSLNAVSSTSFSHSYILRPNTINSNAGSAYPCEEWYGCGKPVVIDNGSLTLMKIRSHGSDQGLLHEYSFGYDLLSNPIWNRHSWDRWGYYKSDDKPYEHEVTNPDETKAWSLNKISFPLGGSLDIEYESDSFIWGGNHYYGGGLRVKKLSFTDKLGNTTGRAYYYIQNDLSPSLDNLNPLNTSGVVGNQLPPPYGVVNSRFFSNPFANNEVHYKKVTEIPFSGSPTNNLGSIVYEFTSWEDYSNIDSTLYPPAYSHGTSLTSLPEIPERDMPVANVYNRDYAWSQLKSKKVFDSNNNLLEADDYLFTEDRSRQVQQLYDKGWIVIVGGAVISDFFYYVDFRIWGRLDVSKVMRTRGGVTTTIEYLYNPYNGLTEKIKTASSDGTCKWAYNDYAFEADPLGLDMQQKNMLSQPFFNYSKNNNRTFCNEATAIFTGGSLTEYLKTSDSRIYPSKSWAVGKIDAGGKITDKILQSEITEYSIYGNIKKQKDVLGVETEFDWDDNYAKIEKVTSKDLSGRTDETSYSYDDSRFLSPTGITYSDGTTASFAYDEFGRLSTATSNSGLVTSNTYTIAGSNISSTNLNKISTELTIDGKTRKATKYFDGFGREIMGTAKKSDTEFIKTSSWYDEYGRLSHIAFPMISTTEAYGDSNPEGESRTTYYSDPLGRVDKAYPNYLKSGINSSSEYGNKNNIYLKTTTYKNPDSTTLGIKTISYSDPFGLLAWTEHQKDDGSMLEVGRSITDLMSYGKRVTATDAKGKSTLVFFDTLGRKIATKRPDMDPFIGIDYPSIGEITEEFVYDDAGNIVKYRDSNLALSNPSKHIKFIYDGLGRNKGSRIYTDGTTPVIQVDTAADNHYDDYTNSAVCAIPMGTLLNTPARTDLKTTYLARAKGKLTCIHEPNDLNTVLFYDSNGRLAEEHRLIDGEHYVFEYYYNIAGEIKEKTVDPTNKIKARYTYNRLGQIEDVFLKKADGSEIQVAHLAYRNDGQVDTLTRIQNKVETTYGYDDLKRLELIKTDKGNPDSTTPFDFQRFFTYDYLSRITGIYNDTVSNNPETKLIGDFRSTTAYDTFGRLKEGTIKSLLASSDNVRKLSYTYDNVGNRLTQMEQNPAGSLIFMNEFYSYIGANRLDHLVDNKDSSLKVFRYDYNGNITTEIESKADQSTTYTYNDFGHLTSITKATLQIFQLSPVSDGYIYKIDTEPYPGFDSSFANEDEELLRLSFEHDSSYPAGWGETRIFLKFDLQGIDPSMVQSATIRLKRDGSASDDYKLKAHKLSYDYGDLGLEDWTIPGDLIGEYTQGTGDDEYFEIEVKNHISTGINAFRIQWDPKYQCLDDPANFCDIDFATYHSSESSNRPVLLISYAPEGGSSLENYVYNSSGKRIKKTDRNGNQFVYVYSGTDVSFDRQLTGFPSGDLNSDSKTNVSDLTYLVAFLFRGGAEPEQLAAADVNRSNSVNVGDLTYLVNYLFKGGAAPMDTILDTAYLNVGGVRLLSISEGSFNSIKYFLTDQIGSSSVVLDKDGNEIARQEYYPFGKSLNASGVSVGKYKFTGKELDDTTGLYYYGARFYSPDLGRFMARDMFDDPNNGNNPYAYVNNNPLIAKDPTGHFMNLAWMANPIDYPDENMKETEITTPLKQPSLGMSASANFSMLGSDSRYSLNMSLGLSGNDQHGATSRETGLSFARQFKLGKLAVSPGISAQYNERADSRKDSMVYGTSLGITMPLGPYSDKFGTSKYSVSLAAGASYSDMLFNDNSTNGGFASLGGSYFAGSKGKVGLAGGLSLFVSKNHSSGTIRSYAVEGKNSVWGVSSRLSIMGPREGGLFNLPYVGVNFEGADISAGVNYINGDPHGNEFMEFDFNFGL